MPINFAGDDIKSITFDGDEISEVTFNGDVVWRGIETIYDFENGNHNGWDVESSTGGDSIVAGLNGTTHAWKHTGFRNGHLPGSNAVDRGPQPGDVFELWFKINSSSSTAISRFEFSADGHNDGDMYRVEWEAGSTPDKTVSMEKYVGGSLNKVSTADFAPSDGTVYRCEIRWNYGNNSIEAQMYDASGSTVSSPASITDDSFSSGSEFTQPGVRIMTNDNETKTWDEMRITDSE